MKGNKKQPKIKRKQQLGQPQSLKIQQSHAINNNKQILDQDDLYQNSSEANWEIKNSKLFNYDRNNDKSVYSSFSTDSKKSVVGNLCKAVEILRNKMPERSLEQIIIRLYQATQLKRDQSCQGSTYGDIGEFQPFNNFERREELNEQLQVKKEADLKSNMGDERPMSIINPNQIKKISSQEGTQAQPQQHPFQIKDKAIKRNEQFFLNNNQQQTNYIYKPKGQQVVIQYLQKDTLKTKFVNVEEQKRYRDQRFVAQSFINRGYGVCECRKQLQVQNKSTFMHRDTYKALSTSMMIFAFRKLESFISIECAKKIKFIDRHQMQSIYITLLNCRVNMQPEYVTTLLKYIKACYGISDVVIGEIESVKLYLTCQKYLYGKNVTMQFLQKIGEIKHIKEIQQTLVYINNRSKRYQQRLNTLRRTRKEKKMRQIISSENGNYNISNSGKSNIQSSSLQVKTQAGQSQISSNEELKVQEFQLNQQYELDIGIEFAKEYINSKELLTCINQLKVKFIELQAWKEQSFQELYYQVMKKALEKVQMETEIIRDIRVKWITTIQTQLFDRLIQLRLAETLRTQILSYFLLSEPNLRKLRQILVLIKNFVTKLQPYSQLQNQNQHQSLNRSAKFQNSSNNTSNQNYSKIYNCENYNDEQHIFEEINFDAQLENLSAELFDSDEVMTNNLTSNNDQSYTQQLQNLEFNSQSKMQQELNV